ncbi:MAG: class I SAM-dependent methyltransferase [Deltaproteobacteria bacterium]
MIRSWAASFRRWFLGDRLWLASRPVSRERMASDPVRLSLKSFGIKLNEDLAPRLAAVDGSGEPAHLGLPSKACTQQDVESAWFAHWCRELRIAPSYHRKLWEYAFLLQVLHERGLLREWREGVGFGCGEEPIASFLAARGVAATVTDLDPSVAKGRGWMETGQHATRRDLAFRPEIVSREAFDRLVHYAHVDMNDIPSSLHGRFDFCWSLCAFEHLGSIEAGLRFVERSMDTLRPGGLAVHTTEFNFLCQEETITTGPTVLFLARHFAELKERLERSGHHVGILDLDVGNGLADRYIDLPPYDRDALPQAGWGSGPVHLKLSLEDFPTTSFGLVVQRG